MLNCVCEILQIQFCFKIFFGGESNWKVQDNRKDLIITLVTKYSLFTAERKGIWESQDVELREQKSSIELEESKTIINIYLK